MSKPEPLTADEMKRFTLLNFCELSQGAAGRLHQKRAALISGQHAVFDTATHRAVSVETLRSFETALRLVVDGRVDRIAKAFAEDRIADIEELLK